MPVGPLRPTSPKSYTQAAFEQSNRAAAAPPQFKFGREGAMVASTRRNGAEPTIGRVKSL